MRNSPKRCKWITLFARLVLALSVGAASIALADDQSQPAQQPAQKPAAPATNAPAQKKTGTDDDEGADYEKNATKRFTPTERTPADRNVSFPVDI
jgi:cytoskeletal protein RodZ